MRKKIGGRNLCTYTICLYARFILHSDNTGKLLKKDLVPQSTIREGRFRHTHKIEGT